MSDWLVWSRGFKGPTLSIQRGGAICKITKEEKKTMIGQPIKLPESQENYDLDRLALLYPAPIGRDDCWEAP